MLGYRRRGSVFTPSFELAPPASAAADVVPTHISVSGDAALVRLSNDVVVLYMRRFREWSARRVIDPRLTLSGDLIITSVGVAGDSMVVGLSSYLPGSASGSLDFGVGLAGTAGACVGVRGDVMAEPYDASLCGARVIPAIPPSPG